MKTIRQLSEELGISKTALRKKLQKLDLLDRLETVNGSKQIPEDIEDLIKKSLQKTEAATAGKEEDKEQREEPKEEPAGNYLPDNTLFLMAQLSEKDKQIAELNQRLKEANIINAGLVQSLQNAQDQIKLLSGTEQKQEKEPEKDTDLEAEKQEPLFQRFRNLFRRGKK